MENEEYINLCDFLVGESFRSQFERLGIIDQVDYYILAPDYYCDACRDTLCRHLPPWNPQCDGNFCMDAAEAWLDTETDLTDEQALNLVPKI